MPRLFFLALAGAAGTVARYLLSVSVSRIFPQPFPLGTLFVNVTGCFAAGLLWSIFEQHWTEAAEWRLIVFIGFMGAFTTFSAVMVESSEFIRSAAWMQAAIHLSLHNILGFLAVFAGAAIGRLA